jgi:hypothetical protein
VIVPCGGGALGHSPCLPSFSVRSRARGARWRIRTLPEFVSAVRALRCSSMLVLASRIRCLVGLGVEESHDELSPGAGDPGGGVEDLPSERLAPATAVGPGRQRDGTVTYAALTSGVHEGNPRSSESLSRGMWAMGVGAHLNVEIAEVFGGVGLTVPVSEGGGGEQRGLCPGAERLSAHDQPDPGQPAVQREKVVDHRH